MTIAAWYWKCLYGAMKWRNQRLQAMVGRAEKKMYEMMLERDAARHTKAVSGKCDLK